MIRLLGVLGGAIFLTAVVGCSQYDDDYQYAPRPGTVEIPATQPQAPPPVVTSATVIGVRYDDPDAKIPASIEIRMRMDNNGPDPVVFDPMTMELTTAQLIRLGPPIVRPSTPINIPASQSADLTVFFPFPVGSSYEAVDLNSLQLRFQIQVGPKMDGMIVNFTRVWPQYYGPAGPYWYYGPPPPFWYGGMVVVHRRW